MPNIDSKLDLWYGGNTHACVGYSNGAVSGCGQIVPPNSLVSSALNGGSMYACVRTEQLQIKCAPVKSLYTPNFFADNWGWFALALVIGWLLYDDHKNKVGFWK